jgi:hypothetical protein
MMPARQYLQPVFPYLDNKVLAAYMSMPIRYLHNQKAHCYAGFHRIKEFGNFRACSYPLSLKDEARFPSALHLARVSRQKTRDFVAALAPGRRKVRSAGVPGRMMDDLLQCPLFEKQTVNSLVREGRAGLREIQKMHTLARFYDYFVLGNNAFSSEGL